MGYVNKLSCQCGYGIKLRMGTGRQLPDIASVRKSFPAEKLKEFDKALETGELGPVFYIENIAAYCDQCKDIREGSILHFQAGEEEKTVFASCHVCGHEVRAVKEAFPCPRCGRILDVEMSGLWD